MAKELSPLRRKDIETGRRLEREAIIDLLEFDAHEILMFDKPRNAKQLAELLMRSAQAIREDIHRL